MDFAKYGFPIKTCYTPSIGGGVNLSGSALIETVSVAHWDFETALGETIRKKYESQYVRVVEIKNVVNRKPWPVVKVNPDGSRYERWCYLVEPGLSSFAFWDEPSFVEAKQKMEEYVDSWGSDQKLHIFQSDQYKLGAGSDREDVFTPGQYLGWIPFTASWQDFSTQHIKPPSGNS